MLLSVKARIDALQMGGTVAKCYVYVDALLGVIFISLSCLSKDDVASSRVNTSAFSLGPYTSSLVLIPLVVAFPPLPQCCGFFCFFFKYIFIFVRGRDGGEREKHQ